MLTWDQYCEQTHTKYKIGNKEVILYCGYVRGLSIVAGWTIIFAYL